MEGPWVPKGHGIRSCLLLDRLPEVKIDFCFVCLVSGLVTEISLGEASEVPGRSGHKFGALCFTTIILPLQWGKEKLSQVQ